MYSHCALLTCLLYSSCQKILTQPAQESYAGCVKIISSYLKNDRFMAFLVSDPILWIELFLLAATVSINLGEVSKAIILPK